MRWLARRLAAREADALAVLAGEPRIPRLLSFDGHVVRRSYLPGVPLYEAAPKSRGYFIDALRALRRLHRAGIAHNDLAKEANWLVTNEGCGIVDFQLATRSPHSKAAFRRWAYEDLRHLLKHKRTYLPQRLTARQLRVLARPTWADGCGARSRSRRTGSSRALCCVGPSASGPSSATVECRGAAAGLG